MPPQDTLQSLCEQGSERLVATDYLAAERHLARAETLALETKDFDTLARLYYPLQESRRQIRNRCLEGTIHLHLDVTPDPADIQAVAAHITHGVLLVSGWGTTAPAEALRQIHRDRGHYVEVFLGISAQLSTGQRLAFVSPVPTTTPPQASSPEDLARRLPAHAIFAHASTSAGAEMDNLDPTPQGVTSLWEKLHLPYLASADAMPEGEPKLQAYRRTIHVDYACEKAHQRAAATARALARHP